MKTTTLTIIFLLAITGNSQAAPNATPAKPVPVIIDTQCQPTPKGQRCTVTFEGGKQASYRIENGKIIHEEGQASEKR